jgi:uncharacterized membrane protein/protein-disulfide isomerase
MSVSFGTVNSEMGGSGEVRQLRDVSGEGYPSLRMLWILRGLCVAGLGISVYLAWTALSMTPVYGCGGGEVIDCGHVLKSKWSKVFGIPVSVPAGGLYASMLVLLGFAGLNAPRAMKQMVWNALTAGACMAGLAALWFISLQIFALSKICPYCVAVHTCGLTMAALMLRNRFSEPHHKSMAASFSAAAVAGLITVQTMTPEPEVFEVIRYDEVSSPEADSTTIAVGDSSGDVFEAPGDIFAAPGEMFEAPSVDEAPSDDSSASTTTEDSGEAVKSESTQPVASTLLLLVPPRLLNLTQIAFSSQEASATEGEKPADAAAAAEGEKASEAAAPSEDGSKPAADTTTEASGTEAAQKKDEKAEEPKAEVTPAAPARKLITVAGNRVTLDVKQWPLLGDAEAQYVFVEMFDYTCPHCRNTHHAIKGAFENFGDRLAILALPVPLERACNDAASGGHPGACELAKISIAVWRVSPEKFHGFHDWMFESTRSPASARAQAEKLVGAEKFRKEYSSKIPSEYVKRHVDLYKKVGQGSVPKLLFPKSTINGEINSKSTMVSTIERELRDVAVK